MSKTKNIKEKVMEKINKDEIKMKPKWFFILGSFLLLLGFLSATVFSVFFVNFLFFILRKHYGPMYQYRLQFILSNFPWWILVVALIGIIVGIRLLKNYDFSYKKNFLMIIIVYILSIVLAGFIIDFFNLDRFFYRPGWRKFYLKENSNLKKDFQPGFRKNYWRFK